MYLKKHSMFFTIVVLTTTTTTAIITPVSPLSASNTNQTWSSLSSIFFLGFLPVTPPTNPPTFIASIFSSGNTHVVWSAGGGIAVHLGGSFHFLSSAALRLLSSGALRLLNGSGATVWDYSTAGRGATNAILEDSGNLVISNGSSTPLWQSFDHPTDTLLPSQNFTVDKGEVAPSGLCLIPCLNCVWPYVVGLKHCYFGCLATDYPFGGDCLGSIFRCVCFYPCII